jgi:hypothetical protein
MLLVRVRRNFILDEMNMMHVAAKVKRIETGWVIRAEQSPKAGDI